jgi:hypothetical protein
VSQKRHWPPSQLPFLALIEKKKPQMGIQGFFELIRVFWDLFTGCLSAACFHFIRAQVREVKFLIDNLLFIEYITTHGKRILRIVGFVSGGGS